MATPRAQVAHDSATSDRSRGSSSAGRDSGDCVVGYFVPDGFELTTAQMSADEKDKSSHRGKALRALAPVIARELGS